jgi:predicted ABC-type sugar transport system permease subunit
MVTVGVLLLVVTLAVAGWSQGTDLLNAKTPFSDIIDHAKLPLLILSGAQLVLLGANILLLVNFLQSSSASVVADVVALSPIRESEVSAT